MFKILQTLKEEIQVWCMYCDNHFPETFGKNERRECKCPECNNYILVTNGKRRMDYEKN